MKKDDMIATETYLNDDGGAGEPLPVRPESGGSVSVALKHLEAFKYWVEKDLYGCDALFYDGEWPDGGKNTCPYDWVLQAIEELKKQNNPGSA
jgi:hypothetical protein